MTIKRKLFDKFPPVSREEWMEKIRSDLRGADFESKLVWKTREGFDVMPFYSSEDPGGSKYRFNRSPLLNKASASPLAGNSWLVRQNIEVTDYGDASLKAVYMLGRGVNSLGFIIKDPGSINSANFDTLLSNICLSETELNILSNGKALEMVDILAGHLMGRDYSSLALKGAIEADPLGRLMLNGTLCIPVEDGLDYLASLIRKSSVLPNLKVLQINGHAILNCGGSAVEELAIAMSMACEYLSAMTDRGIDTDTVVSGMRFLFGTGSGYFMEIAKLRAARILWPVLIKGFKPSSDSSYNIIINSVTGRFNKTLFDPWVNLLRTQTEAMSAILGGTDSLVVELFDQVIKEPDRFSERLARNQQTILREEAYFDKVADPAAGSWYIESLTELISEYSWKLFLEIEENGGFLKSLKSGFIQKRLKASASERKENIASGKEVLLGTSLYPDNNEKIIGEVMTDRLFSQEVTAEGLDTEPVRPFRAAEELEKIRLKAMETEMIPSTAER